MLLFFLTYDLIQARILFGHRLLSPTLNSSNVLQYFLFHIVGERELKGTNVEFSHPYGVDRGFYSAGVPEDFREKAVVQGQRRSSHTHARTHEHTPTHKTQEHLQSHIFNKAHSILCKAGLEMLIINNILIVLP